MKKIKKNFSGNVWWINNDILRNMNIDNIVLRDEVKSTIATRTWIKQVKYNGPATIIFWEDGTKTVAKCSPRDEFDPEKGFCIAYLKKLVGADEVRALMHDWVPETYYMDNLLDKFEDGNDDLITTPSINETITISDVRRRNNN